MPKRPARVEKRKGRQLENKTGPVMTGAVWELECRGWQDRDDLVAAAQQRTKVHPHGGTARRGMMMNVVERRVQGSAAGRPSPSQWARSAT